MAKTKYKVTTPYGILTRSTDRTYTHVVVGIGQHETDIRRRFAEALVWDGKQAAKYEKAVAAGFVPAPYDRSCTLEQYATWGEQHRTAEATNAARLEKALEDNAARIEAGTVSEVTWAGRPDLAEKAAAKFRKTHFFVAVYPVDAN